MLSENQKIRLAFDSHYDSKVKGVFGGEADRILNETRNNASVSIRIK